MRTVYAVQLDVSPPEGATVDECFKDVVGVIREWIVSKYKRAWGLDVNLAPDGASLSPREGHVIRAHARAVDGGNLFTLDWAHPHDYDKTTSWAISCTVAKATAKLQVALLVRISAAAMVLRPTSFDLGRPRVVAEILDHYDVAVNGWRVPNCVEVIRPPQVQAYVNDVLLADNRTLPVIMVSPDNWTEHPLVRPDELMQELRGFAHVAALADKWAAFKLTDSVGRYLSCFDGAVRVYWPGFTRTDEPFAHRLFLPASVRRRQASRTPLGKYLFRFLATISAFRFVEGPVIQLAKRLVAEADQAQVRALRDEVAAGRVAKEELEAQLLEAWDRQHRIEEELAKTREELDAQKAAWAQCQSYVCEVGEEEEEAVAPQPQRGYETVLEAYLAAKKEFSGPLVFLDSAEDAANESPYRNPQRVYEAFEALALVASEWCEKKGALGRSFKDALGELGFDVHRVSMTSKGKWGHQYKFPYKGERRLFEEHVTLGSGQPDKCLSIHWHRDEEDKVVAIGHCGRHLTNTSA